ncbi:hypothetical protein ES703_30473 [subsurface metagenome]
MKESRQRGLAKPLRWAGRTIATVAAVWFLAILIGSAITEGVGSLTIESGTYGLYLLIRVSQVVQPKVM